MTEVLEWTTAVVRQASLTNEYLEGTGMKDGVKTCASVC